MPGGTFQSSSSSSLTITPSSSTCSSPSSSTGVMSPGVKRLLPPPLTPKPSPTSGSGSGSSLPGSPECPTHSHSGLPTTRFLSGHRNFLKPRKSLPGLTPLSTIGVGGKGAGGGTLQAKAGSSGTSITITKTPFIPKGDEGDSFVTTSTTKGVKVVPPITITRPQIHRQGQQPPLKVQVRAPPPLARRDVPLPQQQKQPPLPKIIVSTKLKPAEVLEPQPPLPKIIVSTKGKTTPVEMSLPKIKGKMSPDIVEQPLVPKIIVSKAKTSPEISVSAVEPPPKVQRRTSPVVLVPLIEDEFMEVEDEEEPPLPKKKEEPPLNSKEDEDNQESDESEEDDSSDDDDNNDDNDNDDSGMTITPILIPTINATAPRGRGRGTGRGRGRPRGSTLKARMERAAETVTGAGPAPDPPALEGMTMTVRNRRRRERRISTPSPVRKVPTATATPDSSTKDDGTEGEEEASPTTPTSGRGRGRGRGRGGPRGPYGPRGAKRGGRGSRGGGRGAAAAAKKILIAQRKAEKKEEREKEKKLKAEAAAALALEEETRMSLTQQEKEISPLKAVINSVPSTPTPIGVPVPGGDEEVSNVSSTSTKKKFSKDFVEDRKPVTAETLFEYKWPLMDPDAEYYFLQEQIIEYVGQKGFRRKYPALHRRPVEMEERDFLRDQRIVSETQADLGLTAVNSSEVLDILYSDFPDKYEEYRKIEVERREKELTSAQATQNKDANAATASSSASISAGTRDRSGEFMRRISKSCAKWNAALNMERKEVRGNSCYDLQTSTLNIPQGKRKILPPEKTRVGYFPVSVLPGQFSDSYKEYTPLELKYLPLNTVMYGPIQENVAVPDDEMDDYSDESESDSDDGSGGSSSGDSSSSSSDEDGSDGDVRMNTNGDAVIDPKDSLGICKTCNGDFKKNKDGNQEMLIHCAKCDCANHPTCLELTLDMVPYIKKYDWQCTDCKNCIECNDPADEDKMLFCDCCDRGYHIYCVGLRKVPTGRWHCISCSFCYSCGTVDPSNDDRNAEWHHEFRKGEKGTKYYLHSLCVSCHKIFKKGNYCPHCLKSHLKPTDDKKEFIECQSCEKFVHRQCLKKPPVTGKFGFICESCDAPPPHPPLPSSSSGYSQGGRQKFPSRKYNY